MVEVCQLWKLPDDFFCLDLEAQFQAVVGVTTNASRHTDRRPPCRISWADECLAVAFFLCTLGLPWLLVFITVGCAITSPSYLKWGVALILFLGVHPLPAQSSVRNSRLGLALIRYFSLEILADRSLPLISQFCTPAVDRADFQEAHLPAVYLACPHGVFNYGAIAWCCISRWTCGWHQYTGGATAVKYVPGLRYLDQLVWLVTADRRSIKRVLQERPSTLAEGSRRGGMLGMVPDGIAGAFRSTPGVDELIIGRKRGLMRICLEEGAAVRHHGVLRPLVFASASPRGRLHVRARGQSRQDRGAHGRGG